MRRLRRLCDGLVAQPADRRDAEALLADQNDGTLFLVELELRPLGDRLPDVRSGREEVDAVEGLAVDARRAGVDDGRPQDAQAQGRVAVGEDLLARGEAVGGIVVMRIGSNALNVIEATVAAGASPQSARKWWLTELARREGDVAVSAPLVFANRSSPFSL